VIAPEDSTSKTAALRKWLLLLLLGAMLIAAIEVRFEHQAILREKWQSWIPIVYCGLMSLAIPSGLALKQRAGTKVLVCSFALLAAVGLAGAWFHAGAKPFIRVSALVATAMSKPGELVATDDDSSAPLLAPLSLVGLGAMGILISLLPSKKS
jgi:cytochrome bd-type quinol oxidase subunit 2